MDDLSYGLSSCFSLATQISVAYDRDKVRTSEAEAVMFLFCLILGVVGLILMALPGLNHHTSIGGHHGLHIGSHSGGHGDVVAHSSGAHSHPSGGHAPAHDALQPANAGSNLQPSGFELSSLIPTPRAIFTVMALFGAFAIALQESLHLSTPISGVAALVPAVAIEYFVARPLWNWMFSFQGKPSSPLETMILKEARAVTPFSNGKGVVAINHDGRVVQFSASLPAHQSMMPVRVGDALCIDEVDTARQRVSVSIKTEIDPPELK